ncbi:DUF4845 domain-containing protein [Marinicella sp. W31]|uniref:DUF4845 domain-containing protein n=1 Tax=Marinicella sp. W31 TaxID=3023713 RepID=UPI003756C496
MQTYKKQKGLTLIGFLFVLVILGIMLYAGMQIVPVYLEHRSVVNSMKKVASEPGAVSKSPGEIKKELGRMLNISYVTNVTPNDFKLIRGNTKELQVKYEVRKDFVGNLAFVMSFNERVSF